MKTVIITTLAVIAGIIIIFGIITVRDLKKYHDGQVDFKVNSRGGLWADGVYY